MHSLLAVDTEDAEYKYRAPFLASQRIGGFVAHTTDTSQNDLLNLDCHTFLLIKGRHGLCSIIFFFYLRQTEAASLRPRNGSHNWWRQHEVKSNLQIF